MNQMICLMILKQRDSDKWCKCIITGGVKHGSRMATFEKSIMIYNNNINEIRAE